MAEDLRTLIAIQGWVLKCRQLAAEERDPETARLLAGLADKIERQAREADTERLKPLSIGRAMKKPPLG